MNTGHLEDELLQRYFDGELSNGSAAEVKQHLESCESCRRRHRSLERLRAFINMTVTDAAREVDFNALYGRIEAGVDKARDEKKVVSIRTRLGATLRRPVLIASVALAAAVMIIIFRTAPSEPVARGGAGRKRSERTVLVDSRSAIKLRNSEVVQVDFGANTGTVFEIALAEGVSTPVVWINDEADEMVGP
ncbi:MAG: zf-HC2 domain-containing protein [Deltaproteobacteria bacterium]|nr:zf-HC2 domain-containing protein [Deltaproteobacteria bacterium]